MSLAVVPVVPSADGVGAAISVANLGYAKTIVVAGDFEASVTLECTADGVTWAAVMTFNGSGEVTLNFAATEVRVRVSGHVSGTATMGIGGEDMTTEPASGVALPVPGADGAGAAVDVSSMGEFKSIMVRAPSFVGSLTVEVSQDNVTWGACAGFTGSGLLQLQLNAQWMRVRLSGYQSGVATVGVAGVDDSPDGALPDGSVLSGTYLGDTVVLGDATFDGDVTVVGGSLFIHGNLTTFGWDLDVDGDMSVRGYANFSGVPVGEAQGTVRVRGDLFTTSGEYHPEPGESPSLTVDGDWIGGAGGFDGDGLDGANGLTVVVSGDVVLGGLGLTGGDSTLALDAGAGGILVVYGDCRISPLLMDGGGSALAGRSAGAGGQVQAASNFTGTISASGGNALSTDAGNGGVGGNIHIFGSACLAFCEVNGGACASNDPLAVSGIGGIILIDGSLTGDGHFGLNGGFRDGTGVVAAVIPGGPDGGTLFVRGDMNVGDIDADGGTNSYSPDANTNAGDGGRVECSGDIRIRNQAVMSGGEVFFALGNGGNGGNITCAHLSVAEGAGGVFVPGGFAQATGINGAGGFVWVKTGMSVSSLRMLDGAGPGAAPTDITYLILNGPCAIWDLLMDDRGADTQIRTESQSPPVSLKVNLLMGKNTLNAFDGTVATGPILAPETQIFFTDVAGAVWYSNTGVVVP